MTGGFSDADLDRLERAANAATPGPWDFTHGMDARFMVLGPDGMDVRGSGHADGEFIAAADPSTVLRLVAELRAEWAARQRARELVAEHFAATGGDCYCDPVGLAPAGDEQQCEWRALEAALTPWEPR